MRKEQNEPKFGTKYCVECCEYQEKVGEIKDGTCFGCKKRLEEYRRRYENVR